MKNMLQALFLIRFLAPFTKFSACSCRVQLTVAFVMTSSAALFTNVMELSGKMYFLTLLHLQILSPFVALFGNFQA
jgi:hypothetical protein